VELPQGPPAYRNWPIFFCKQIRQRPPSRGGASISSSTLGTPHTARQLHKKASSIKEMLAKQSQSPSSPSKCALDELIKRCELAIYNAAFTLKELNDLRSESRVQQQKRVDQSAKWLLHKASKCKKQGN
jgi:hypothetical protein